MRRAAAGTVVAAVALAVPTGPGAAAQASVQASVPVSAGRCHGMQVAAHRGGHDARHTENTVRSAQLAVAQHADVVEGDMAMTRDGAWVMMHDDTVDRTTNGHGPVRRLTLAQVRRLRTEDGVRGGVPTVDADLRVLDHAPGTHVQFEVKPDVTGVRPLGRLVAVLARHRLQQRMTITSFHPDVLASIRRHFPGWRTALIVDRRVPVTRARSLGQEVVAALGVLSPAYVGQLHASGLRVDAWTVDTTAAAARAVAVGADQVITDVPTRIRGWCGA